MEFCKKTIKLHYQDNAKIYDSVNIKKKLIEMLTLVIVSHVEISQLIILFRNLK